jgi:thioredoxin-like negative regulator of GroEL
MQKYLKLLIISIFSIIFGINTINAEQSNNAYVTDYNIALMLSKDTKQNIIVIFSASWCEACKILKNDLPSIEGFDNKIICILDIDDNKHLSKQFKIKSLPTSILVDSSSIEKSRLIGYKKDKYEEWLKSL